MSEKLLEPVPKMLERPVPKALLIGATVAFCVLLALQLWLLRQRRQLEQETPEYLAVRDEVRAYLAQKRRDDATEKRRDDVGS